MPETPDEKEKRLLKELEGKNIEYYSVMLSAWVTTKMELDKTLVTLSAAAIGLLVTILTTIGANNIFEIILFTIAICLFLTTIWSALRIYKLNSVHIENALRGSSDTDTKLEKYDKLSIRTFLGGAFFALLIGILSAQNKLVNKDDNNMSTKEKIVDHSIHINDSFNGVASLQPEMILKSLYGAQNLSPEIIQTTQQPQEQNNSASQNNTDKTDTE